MHQKKLLNLILITISDIEDLSFIITTLISTDMTKNLIKKDTKHGTRVEDILI